VICANDFFTNCFCNVLSYSIYASIVALAFAITSLLLALYDRLVTRRQERTKNAALRVINTMIPSTMQEKVLKGYDGRQEGCQSNIIASFFPETTVIFADISGFTAWASTREPAQVFQLLETIYRAFDEIARRKGIFKVETVGDCYVSGMRWVEMYFDSCSYSPLSPFLWFYHHPKGCRGWTTGPKTRPCSSYGALCS